MVYSITCFDVGVVGVGVGGVVGVGVGVGVGGVGGGVVVVGGVGGGVSLGENRGGGWGCKWAVIIQLIHVLVCWMNEWILYLYTIVRSAKLVGLCVWAGVYVSSYLKFD